jgi:transcriptional regulator with XRE-family HTH domain
MADIRKRREAAPTSEEIGEAIAAARQAGLTGAEIAEAIGIQRQWMYKRFSAQIRTQP